MHAAHFSWLFDSYYWDDASYPTKAVMDSANGQQGFQYIQDLRLQVQGRADDLGRHGRLRRHVATGKVGMVGAATKARRSSTSRSKPSSGASRRSRWARSASPTSAPTASRSSRSPNCPKTPGSCCNTSPPIRARRSSPRRPRCRRTARSTSTKCRPCSPGRTPCSDGAQERPLRRSSPEHQAAVPDDHVQRDRRLDDQLRKRPPGRQNMASKINAILQPYTVPK